MDKRNIGQSIPGLLAAVIVFMAQVSPGDALSNLGAWAKLVGIEQWPGWLTDGRVTVAAIVGAIGFYVFAFVRGPRTAGTGEPDVPGEDPVESTWLPEVEQYRKHAKKLWEQLRVLFQSLGMYGQGGPPNALTIQVDNAGWPDDSQLPQSALSDFVRRLYPGHQRRFEKQRFKMALLVDRWATRLEGASGVVFAVWLRGKLGPRHYRTMKLLRYIETAKAASIGNTSPDYSSLDRVGRVLNLSTPDTEADPRPSDGSGDPER